MLDAVRPKLYVLRRNADLFLFQQFQISVQTFLTCDLQIGTNDGDSAVAVIIQLFNRLITGCRVVNLYTVDPGTFQGAVHQNKRDSGVPRRLQESGRLTRRNHNHPVNLFAEQETDILSFQLRIILRIADHRGVSRLSEPFPKVLEQRTGENVRDIKHHHADHFAPAGHKPPCHLIYFIMQFADCFLYLRSVFRAQIAAVQIFGYRRKR